jgi:hypothetical protein
VAQWESERSCAWPESLSDAKEPVAVKVRLNDGINLVVNANIDDFRKAYEDALKNSLLLEVENGQGKMRVLNPVQILYFEDATDADAESDQQAGAPAQDLVG